MLECTEANSRILPKIIRALPLQILVKNLTRVYKIFKNNENLNYSNEIFWRYEEEIDFDDNEKEKYELIIESAFCYFYLISYFKDHRER